MSKTLNKSSILIPKRIYYIWFGYKPLNKEQIECINSWKKYLPDYEIIEINESNFDINSCQMSRVAYKEHWYNYVSDYARLKVIYEYGGIYLDTDVEVLKSFDDIINKGPFFGFSKTGDDSGSINTGIGFGCEKHNALLKKLISQYEEWEGDSFVDDKGYTLIKPCPVFNSVVFEQYGVKQNNQYQRIGNISFYPSEYFEGFDLKFRREYITPNTHSIHRYTGYANPKIDRWYMRCYAKYNYLLGNKTSFRRITTLMFLFHPIKSIKYRFYHKAKH